MESLHEAHFFTEQIQQVSDGNTVISESSSDPDPYISPSSPSVGSENISYALFKQPLDSLTQLELRNRTYNNELSQKSENRSKRQFTALSMAAAQYIPKFLVKTIGPVFSSLLGSSKSQIATK